MKPFHFYFSNPRILLSSLIRDYGSWLPDKTYLKMQYFLRMGTNLNLDSPETFSEKLQWLKLYNRQPEYTAMVDKYEAKFYISNIIGSEYIVPTFRVWNRPEEINFDELPNRFVLKTTNAGGCSGVIICKNKEQLDKGYVVKALKKAFAIDLYRTFREWPYKNVKPRVMAEAYLCDDSEHDCLTDYKFFCYNGYADCVMVCIDRQIQDPKFFFFDKEWNLLPLNVRGKNTDPSFKLPKPKCMNDMFEIAGLLSKGIPFLRVDLYCSNEKPYFGEATFFPSSGYDKNLLNETERIFGSKIDLSVVKQ